MLTFLLMQQVKAPIEVQGALIMFSTNHLNFQVIFKDSGSSTHSTSFPSVALVI